LLTLNGKGTSGVGIQGTTAGGNATASYVGELISSVIPNSSAVNTGSTARTNLTSISLTAGDWDVYGNVTFLSSNNTLTVGFCWISTTSATAPDYSLFSGVAGTTAIVCTFIGATAPYFRASLSATTTIYLSGSANFNTGTCGMSGGIYARRVR
jgi:hypothetical protein